MKSSIVVQNLKCDGCAHTITSRLSNLKSISNLIVNVESSTVSFDTENEKDILLIKDRLKVMGYPSIDDKNSMATKAVSFISCASGKLTLS